MVGVTGNGHHHSSREALRRAEARLAWTAIRKTLESIPDNALAGFLASTNTEAFQERGITSELIAVALGDPRDDAERQRRLRELFTLPPERMTRLRKIIRGEGGLND
jgi:hypothetical protein